MGFRKQKHEMRVRYGKWGCKWRSSGDRRDQTPARLRRWGALLLSFEEGEMEKIEKENGKLDVDGDDILIGRVDGAIGG